MANKFNRTYRGYLPPSASSTQRGPTTQRICKRSSCDEKNTTPPAPAPPTYPPAP